MVNFIALAREHWMNILVPMGFVVGWYLDKQQDQNFLIAVLFRELKPGEEVTWK
uniref:NADH dehydrogenase [ubiquinone] 1 beta subcomplex subunit 1 n=1 Tax=Mola mola TaxID=94237 RepID=A0A3Q4BK83_MOLML